MKEMIGLDVEIDIGEAVDGRLVGLKTFGRIVRFGTDNGIEFAVVELSKDISYVGITGEQLSLHSICVVARHVGSGLKRLAGFLRREITVNVIPASAEDIAMRLSWERVRSMTVALAVLSRLASSHRRMLWSGR